MSGGVLHARVLGCEVTLKFRDIQCATEAAEQFNPLLIPPWRSPDLIIECDWPHMRRDFIRSRTSGQTELPGVRIFSEEYPHGASWSSPLPPFPPVNLVPFRDRFVRLHAACVVNPEGEGIAIMGESGLGKTTIAFQLVHRHGYTLITDEDLFLYRRSLVAEPFPAGSHPWQTLRRRPNGIGREMWTGVIAEGPARLRNAVVLDASHSSQAAPRQVSEQECFRAMLAARRPSGSQDQEDIATAALAARSLRTVRVRGGDYQALLAAAEDLAHLEWCAIHARPGGR